MPKIFCDRLSCKYLSNPENFECQAEEVIMEAQFDGDLCCLTWEKKATSLNSSETGKVKL